MRYFIELAYDGTRFGGFQIQSNAHTIQAEVTKALATFYRTSFTLTGSSRTDAGVHAFQNFFHVDTEIDIQPRHIYNINSILDDDIVIKKIFPVSDNAHCRFLATHRTYCYFIYQHKNPFLKNRAWFYPYPLNLELLNKAAAIIQGNSDFTSFSKRNTQVQTKLCTIVKSSWEKKDDQIVYTVKANRFLRGMVRGLVGTMLQIGRGKISLNDFQHIIESKDCKEADFSAPPHGLFLMEVGYPSL